MRTTAVGLLLAGLVALCGCGSSEYKSVSGVVLLDGEPVPEAAVAFVPEDPHGEGATAYTDEDGRFRMKSAVHDGVKPGKYKVRIEALAERPAPVKGMAQIMAEKHAGGNADAKSMAKDAAAVQKQQAQESKAAAKRKRVNTPKVYNDIDKSPLRAEIPAQTDYKFELTKDAK
jgi:Carboxypeptidase regulatory-like domain